MKEEGGRVQRITDAQEGVCCKQAWCGPAPLCLIPLTAALDPRRRCAWTHCQSRSTSCISSGNADLVFLSFCVWVRVCTHAG